MKNWAVREITTKKLFLTKFSYLWCIHKINNHLFRGERITNLVNDRNINMVTCLGIAGHASIGSQKPYVKSKFSQTIAASANLHNTRIINEDKKIDPSPSSDHELSCPPSKQLKTNPVEETVESAPLSFYQQFVNFVFSFF